jgi:hypothetical protein
LNLNNKYSILSMTKFGLITAMACLAFATADSLGKITFKASS